MTAHEAFLWQARSDFAVFELLLAQDREAVPECHPLHYLQMATEKLAKAAFGAAGLGIDTSSHVAFSHVPYQLARGDVARALGFKRLSAYRSFLSRTAPVFRQIDELNPAVGPQRPGGGAREGPNAEYPWRGRDASGTEIWVAPAGHNFGLVAKLQRSGDAAQVRQFVRILLERFEAIFH